MFYGRGEELEILAKKYESRRKEFGVIYGRRRIGKTELVDKFTEGKEGIYFQAICDNNYGNRKAFSRLVAAATGLHKNYVYESWEDALDELKTHFEGKRYFLVIDEYPVIASQFAGFSSIIQDFYDHSGENLYLLLLGSDVSFLRNEIMNKASPLYMRRTFELCLGKMKLCEALLFLDGLSTDDKFNYLSLMSTYPYYLGRIDKSMSFEENVVNLLFSRGCVFENLPDAVLSDSTTVQNMYGAILKAIAHRHTTIKDISEYIREDRTKVSKYMTTLLSSEIVEKRETYGGTKKTHYYAIDDPLLRFWYMFVQTNEKAIRANGRDVYEREKERIHDFLCRGFEQTSLLYLNELNARDELGQIFDPVKNFRADYVEKLGRSVEIDGLSRCGRTLLVVECKYENKPFTNGMMERLKESATLFGDTLDKVYCIFSKSGFSDDFEKSPDIRCFGLDDILGVKR